MSNIIFDFDGTIADSFAMVIGIFHEMTHRTETLPLNEIQRLRGLSLIHAAEELRIQPWKIPFMVVRGRRIMHTRMHEVKPHPGMVEVIRELYDAGHKLYIMSSNSVQNIQIFLKQQGMSKEFIELYGGIGLLGKAPVLKKIIRKNHLNQNDTFYIGDEVRDVVAAKRANVKVLAVTWGYNNAEILDSHHPDQLIGKPIELTKHFKAAR